MLLVKEETYWKQRAKMHWLRDGDKNTKFFHGMTNARRKINRITQLQDANGNTIGEQDGICGVARNYFHDLFNASDNNVEMVVEVINPIVTNNDNAMLTAPFDKEDFRTALYHMHPDKSPGPDGLNAAFYRRFWYLLW